MANSKNPPKSFEGYIPRTPKRTVVQNEVLMLTPGDGVEIDEMCLFIDESGNHKLSDPKNKNFVLGGCACYGHMLKKVHSDWEHVRYALTGNREGRVHFKDRSRRLKTQKGQQAVCDFFDHAHIARLAVAIIEDQKFSLKDEHGREVVRLAMERLLHEHSRIKGHYTKLLVIFEDGPTMKHVYNVCRDLVCDRSDDTQVQMRFRWATKKQKVPFLEIADGIAHTMSGQVRNWGAENLFDRRFSAMFRPKNNYPGRPIVTKIFIESTERQN